MKKVLIVCHGNICRSPMAEVILKDKLTKNNLQDNYQVDSAGVAGNHNGENADPRTIKTLQDHNLPQPSLSRQVNGSDLQDSDYILVMDDSNYNAIQNKLQQNNISDNKLFYIHHFDQNKNNPVEDPYYGNQKQFDELYYELDSALEGFVKYITKK